MREEEKEIVRWSVRHVIMLKVVVAVGLVAAHFLPMEWAVAASMGANMVWLWKL